MATRPISTEPIIIAPVGGSLGVVTGGVISSVASVTNTLPVQLLGFIPLTSCTATECRQFNGKCYNNPVFGTLNVATATYENDMSTFFINDSMRRRAEFAIYKLNPITLVWEEQAIIGKTYSTSYNTTYGSFYRYNYFTLKPNFFGVQINWGYVLTNNGSGKYKLVARVPALYWRQTPNPYCLQSEPFELNEFNCNRAHGTAKFEANQSGRVGSITTDGYVFDICGVKLYDSIRMKGFFGYEKTTYDEVMLEYQTGLQDRVRDESLQKFTWASKPMPKYIHDRFKVYGLMADSLWVSDYNLNNADYELRAKLVVKGAGYEPEYPKGSRLSWVKTEFKEGIQGVIKSSVCAPTNVQR